MKICVLGREEFCTGFRLAGITKVQEVQDQPDFSILHDPEVGILILDEDVFLELPEYRRFELENMVMPTIVVLSTRDSQENLRKMIIQSIGVDLWEKN
ncbi:V-type ATP synthase subunit F [Candidatus Woesearchaeota archaeon]|nr:V-type ATP synthase subunit F [Candidatus Woesearchaeota archaeon]HIH37521.1 V-type ATP synthase subunit F [Candidatus Woesearchaeota archaeon]HIH49730.1 V-type ATP synthase subunit F [Candidatus Woesearchaeota archaeon]HIJ03224.1 V-type ATP synthase subunit F [Candidatus Woesearchaeota archaeon]